MAEVEVRDNPDKQQFEVYADGVLAGFSSYDIAHGTIDFLHTEVDDAYEGEGLGSALVRGALDAVRADGELRVTASCPFVRAWIRRHPDYQDLTRR
jgi:hypothetical protein